jgi:hypothetical protein
MTLSVNIKTQEPMMTVMFLSKQTQEQIDRELDLINEVKRTLKRYDNESDVLKRLARQASRTMISDAKKKLKKLLKKINERQRI